MVAKIYIAPEAAITWLSSGGTEPLTLTGVASGAGREGDQYDFSATARPQAHAWRAWVKLAGTPVVNETIRVYWKTSDGTSPDNDTGVVDADMTDENKLAGLLLLGTITVNENVNTVLFVRSGRVDVDHRYGQPVFWNATANALSATAADHGFSLVPIPFESQ